MTEGCPERLDPEFQLYVLNFRQAWQARNAALLEQFTGPVIRLRNPGAAQHWLESA